MSRHLDMARKCGAGWTGGMTEDKFWERILLVENCWEWLGWVHPKGYAGFTVPAGKIKVARWAYEHFRSPLPNDLVIDHLCRNRRCVNPWHLEPVTNKENILRGVSPSARNARKACCPRGHALDGVRSGPRGGPARYCKTCNRDRSRIRYARAVASRMQAEDE